MNDHQFNRAALAALLAALAAPGMLTGQRCQTGVSLPRVAAIAGGFTALQTTVILIRQDDWWVTPRTGFHFGSGGSPSRSQDKLLHAAIAYQASQVAILAWDWACVPPTLAAWLGAAVGIAVGLPKEIGDGLHEGKGFATDDFGASVGAAILPALHRTWAPSRVIQLKGNYWPSAEFRDRTGGLPQLENDYAGQRYFLAIDPGLLPSGAGAWPDWLGLAVGHSVPTWLSAPPEDEWYVTLDLNARGLPVNTPWWQKVAALIDQLHLPLPGLRLTSGEVRFGLY